jgi:hypothetical protein
MQSPQFGFENPVMRQRTFKAQAKLLTYFCSHFCAFWRDSICQNILIKIKKCKK